MSLEPLRIFAPCGMLGYGIPERSFARGMDWEPHVIAVDAGSTDPGPFYLGAGVPFTNRTMVKRDLTLILKAAFARALPVVIGSAGGGGARAHVRWLLEVIDEVNQEHGLGFPTAVIMSDIDPDLVKSKRRDSNTAQFELERELTDAEIDRATNIVAQMGPEPIMEALDQAQLIVCGRASDPAVMAAPALRLGYPRALAVHLGKILECGAAAAFPRHGTDGLLGTLLMDSFLVEPASLDQVCTVESVAAHTLYERANPFQSSWPGGTLDLTQTRFEQYDERTVRISGSRYVPNPDYWVKIEGAAHRGFRTITIGGVRDPLLCQNIDSYEANVRERVRQLVAPLREGESFDLHFHIYGRDGVMGPAEPRGTITSHELGIVIDVVAESEAVSRQVLAICRSAALHSTYPGRKAIAGNLAFPFSPSDIAVGDVYEFNIYHLLRLEHPTEVFPIQYSDSRSLLAAAVPAG